MANACGLSSANVTVRLLRETINARISEGNVHHGGDLHFLFFASCRPAGGPAAASSSAPLATNTLRDPAAELQSLSSVSAIARWADVQDDADEQDLEATAAFAGPGAWTEVHVTAAPHG